MLHPVQQRQRCPCCSFLRGRGLNWGLCGPRLGGLYAGEDGRGVGGGGGCAGWGVAAPLSTGAAGSGNPVGVGKEGEGGGIGTLGTIAAAWLPPRPPCRVFLASLICSVTVVGRVREVEGLGAPSSEAGTLRGRGEGGALSKHKLPPPRIQLHKENSDTQRHVGHDVTHIHTLQPQWPRYTLEPSHMQWP